MMAFIKHECKQILRSTVYFFFVMIYVAFIVMQMGEIVEKPNIVAPKKNSMEYTTKISLDEADIMQSKLAELMFEASINSFSTYPFMIYKEEILREEELSKITSILEKASGIDYLQLLEEYSEKQIRNASDSSEINYDFIPISNDYLYLQFEKDMVEACKIIGSGSGYEADNYKNGVEKEMNYEEALAEYNALIKIDGITGSFARIFCDYSSIVLSVLPIFVAITQMMKDKRYKVEAVIYSSQSSSIKIIVGRYISNVIMIFIPVMIIASFIQVPLFVKAASLDVIPDYFAFWKYTLMWLLPEVMVVIAFAFMLTAVSREIVAIIIQVAWAIGTINSSTSLNGNFEFSLLPRWNSTGNTLQFISVQSELYFNRIFYAVLAICILMLTILVYRIKRQGGGKIIGKVFSCREKISISSLL